MLRKMKEPLGKVAKSSTTMEIVGSYSSPTVFLMFKRLWLLWLVSSLGRWNSLVPAFSWLTRHPPCALQMSQVMFDSSLKPAFMAPLLSCPLSPTVVRPPIPPTLSSVFGQLSLFYSDFDPWLPSGVYTTHNPSPDYTMDGVKEAIATLSQLTAEVKTYLCRTYSAVYTSVKQNEEMTTKIRYNTTQLSCQDSRIDDLERNLFELMGKVDIIREEISVLTSKYQCSHVQDAPTVNQEMVDAALVQQQNFG